MQVTERVDVEDVYEARRQQKVLQETREYMPWVAVKQGREEVDAWLGESQQT